MDNLKAHPKRDSGMFVHPGFLCVDHLLPLENVIYGLWWPRTRHCHPKISALLLRCERLWAWETKNVTQRYMNRSGCGVSYDQCRQRILLKIKLTQIKNCAHVFVIGLSSWHRETRVPIRNVPWSGSSLSLLRHKTSEEMISMRFLREVVDLYRWVPLNSNKWHLWFRWSSD